MQAIEVAAVHQEETCEVSIFLINRAVEDDIEVTLDVRGFEGYDFVEHIEMYTDDLDKSVHPDLIKPVQNMNTRMDNGKITAVTKKLSWNVIRIKEK